MEKKELKPKMADKELIDLINKEINKFRDKSSMNRYDSRYRDYIAGLQKAKEIIKTTKTNKGMNNETNK